MKYTKINLDLKEDACFRWRTTDKAVHIDFGMNWEGYGDDVGWIWVPKWAIKYNRDTKSYELWWSENWKTIKVYVSHLKETYELNKDEFIQILERYGVKQWKK